MFSYTKVGCKGVFITRTCFHDGFDDGSQSRTHIAARETKGTATLVINICFIRQKALGTMDFDESFIKIGWKWGSYGATPVKLVCSAIPQENSAFRISSMWVGHCIVNTFLALCLIFRIYQSTTFKSTKHDPKAGYFFFSEAFVGKLFPPKI